MAKATRLPVPSLRKQQRRRPSPTSRGPPRCPPSPPVWLNLVPVWDADPMASTEPLCKPGAAGTGTQSHRETLFCASSRQKSGSVLQDEQDTAPLLVLPRVRNRAHLMPLLGSGRRAQASSSHPFRSRSAFLFISFPKTDTGAAACHLQQHPGKWQRAWPWEEAALLCGGTALI